MSDIVRVETNKRLSRAIVYNGIIFLSGSTADDRRQDIHGQTKQVLAKIDKVLGDLGSDRSHLLSVLIWLKDIARDFSGLNEVWEDWISPNAAPARATAQCDMGASDILVEIVVTAAATGGSHF